MRGWSPYTGSGGLELDLRQEMNRFMFGASDEVAKGGLLILRRMRRTEGATFPVSKEDLERCECMDEGYENEPDKMDKCPICQGEGFLFDDEIVTGYKTNRFEYQDVEKHVPYGKNIASMSFFYIEFHEDVSRYDKIIEPLVTLDGSLVTPMKVRQRHNIHMAERFRADNGRTEYWRCSCWTD